MKERVLTAVVLLAIVVGALFFDPTGWAVKVLIVAVAAGCAFELGKLVNVPWSAGISLFGVVITVFAKFPPPPTLYLALIALISAPLICISVDKKNEIGGAFFSVGWILGTIIPLFVLASSKTPSTWPLLLIAAIPIWCGDTAAIFVGKAFGKHKLAPSISPNKTWEGSIGNLVACVGAALSLGVIFHYPMLLMVLLGLNCGILGQAGDLFESWLKRKADVKDSGNILPGHGGLLDRLDSLMATAPFSLLILQSLVVPGTHS